MDHIAQVLGELAGQSYVVGQGRWVRCLGCDRKWKVKLSRKRRLRNTPCSHCGGRLTLKTGGLKPGNERRVRTD